MRLVVVGGGILGLAAARQAICGRPELEVVLLEKDDALARHQTTRNSGVVHAGIYYAPGSLKARLCRRGVTLLRDHCRAAGIPYDECGKVVVATREDELGRLEELERRGRENGVPGLRRLDAAELRTVEPHVRGIAALHSPATAITDFAAVTRSFAADVAARGGEIRLGASVVRVDSAGRTPVVELTDGSRVGADRVLVCAGLHADRLARASGEPAAPRIVPFRGEYWALRASRADLVRGLVYPVPDPSLPFLGIHLTRRVDGSVLIGPSAVLATAREGYRRRDVRGRDMVETLLWGGMWRLTRRHWRAGATELARSGSRRLFVQAARRYVPELRPRDVEPAPAGVRAQAVAADGSMVDDFRVTSGDGVVWVRNAPSPAATSSMAIAEELVERLELG